MMKSEKVCHLESQCTFLKLFYIYSIGWLFWGGAEGMEGLVASSTLKVFNFFMKRFEVSTYYFAQGFRFVC